ncbi:MAG: hypothetical protein J3K34DRAFT_436314 [Monoraphidium minutum]|nr:MAG: hypothetical protein J3K34DRAFT_436314 [Monoraphidium minutum]
MQRPTRGQWKGPWKGTAKSGVPAKRFEHGEMINDDQATYVNMAVLKLLGLETWESLRQQRIGVQDSLAGLALCTYPPQESITYLKAMGQPSDFDAVFVHRFKAPHFWLYYIANPAATTVEIFAIDGVAHQDTLLPLSNCQTTAVLARDCLFIDLALRAWREHNNITEGFKVKVYKIKGPAQMDGWSCGYRAAASMHALIMDHIGSGGKPSNPGSTALRQCFLERPGSHS